MLLLNAKGLAKDPVCARPPVVWRLVRITAPYNCCHGNGIVEYSIVFCNGGSGLHDKRSTVTPLSKALAPNALSILIQTARFHMPERLKQPWTQMSR